MVDEEPDIVISAPVNALTVLMSVHKNMNNMGMNTWIVGVVVVAVAFVDVVGMGSVILCLAQ